MLVPPVVLTMGRTQGTLGTPTCSRYASTTSESREETAPPTRCFEPPCPGDPRVKIQNDQGKAKEYQVRQVLAAVRKKVEGSHDD